MKKLHVILGNQLFPINEINKKESSMVFMAEDYDLCSEHKNHKLKILNFLVSMREYRDQLDKHGFKVFYSQIDEPDFVKPYESKLFNILNQEKISEVLFYEIEDYLFEKKIWDKF